MEQRKVYIRFDFEDRLYGVRDKATGDLVGYGWQQAHDAFSWAVDKGYELVRGD